MKRDYLIVIPLVIISLYVLGLILKDFKDLLLPFAFAVLFSILFYPLVKNLQKKKIHIIISLMLVILIFVAFVTILGSILYSSSLPLIHELPFYQNKMNMIVKQVSQELQTIFLGLGLSRDAIDFRTLLGVTTITADALSSVLETFAAFLGKSGLVLLFMLFMLAGTGELVAKINKTASFETFSSINLTFYEIGSKIRRYLLVRILIAAGTGFLTMIILWIVGLKHALFWGVLAFIVSTIPSVGIVIGIGLPFVFSLLFFDDILHPLLVVVFLSIEYMIIGNIVQPKLVAKSLNLSPLLVLFALIFWGLIWGIWGMVLAVPLTTSIKIVFEHVPPLQNIAILMSTAKH